MELNKKDLIKIYEQMVMTRAYDLKTNEWYNDGKLKECVHQSTGQEAISIGSCYGLRKTDQVMPSLRTRGAFIAKGVEPKTMLLAMSAKKTGPSLGHETSHHAVYPELGVLPGTGMVGSSISIGAGAALAMKMKNKDDVVLNYFGDGAANRGDFHEAINLAAVWKLPCIFIVENNQVSLTTEQEEVTATEKFSDRAAGYGIPGYTIDGNDVLEVYKYTQEAIERARKGEGPTLLDCVTYRCKPHVGWLPESRDSEIIKEWEKKCPITKLEKYLTDNKIASQKELQDIKIEADKHLNKAFEEVQDEPDVVFEDMLNHVYEEGVISYE